MLQQQQSLAGCMIVTHLRLVLKRGHLLPVSPDLQLSHGFSLESCFQQTHHLAKLGSQQCPAFRRVAAAGLKGTLCTLQHRH